MGEEFRTVAPPSGSEKQWTIAYRAERVCEPFTIRRASGPGLWCKTDDFFVRRFGDNAFPYRKND